MSADITCRAGSTFPGRPRPREYTPAEGAHPAEPAGGAVRLRAAELAAMADQVHVEFVGILRVDQGQQFVVRLLEGRVRPEQAEPAPDPVDVDVHRDLRPVPGEHLDAGRRLPPDSREVRSGSPWLRPGARSRASRGRGRRRPLPAPPGSAEPSDATARRGGSPVRPRRPERRAPPPSFRTVRSVRRRPGPGSGRWWPGTGSSAPVRRSGGGAAG